MYTGFKPSISANKSIVPGLGETQLQTLQREVDTYTRKLQQEKKRYFSTQDAHKIVSQEHEKEKLRLNQLKKENNKAQNVIIQAKIKNLEASLDKAVSTYDQTIAHNAKLKTHIDMLRREKKNYIESQILLEQQIKQCEDDIQKKSYQIENKKNTAESLKNGIYEIKQKNEQQRQLYVKQFETLQKDYLRQKKQRQQYKFQRHEKPEPIGTQPLLKHRLKKLIKSNKNKIKMIDQYKKHMKQIQQAFDQIKKNSGIDDLNQITNTFVKSQQQNYSLYNYMDSLSRNIDNLQKANAELEQNIKKQQQAENERKKNLETMPEEQKKSRELQQYVLKKQQAAQSLNKLIQAIKPNLTSTLIQLASSNLNDEPSKITQYQIGININDKSIQTYLSDLQKFINTLLMLKQQIKPKIVNSMKQNVTVYSKPIPNITNDDVVAKDKSGQPKDEAKLMDQSKFREYAMDYWEKRKNKNAKQ